MKLTRRNFIKVSSAAATSIAVLGGAGQILGQTRHAPSISAQLPPESLSDPVNFLTGSYFEPFVGTVIPAQSGRARAVSFLLAEVRDLSIDSNRARGYGGESFSLILTAPDGSSPQPVVSGQFYSILHPTEGTATIYRLEDGARVLRLTSFHTSNGPDVHVYMVAADDAKDVATVEKAGFIDLGVLKGNIGDQNYVLGSDLDLGKYRAVSIWCKRFSVNFGAAALRPAESSQNR